MQTIKIFVNGERGIEAREIKGYSTKSRYLFVHHEIYRGTELELWTITHIPTGRAILSGIKYRKNALKACNDYLSKCVGWENLNKDNTTEFYRNNHENLNAGRDCAREE